jgi:hypothetical protein
LKRNHCAHQKSGAGEEDERERDFSDDQNIAQTAMPEPAAHSFAGVLQWLGELFPYGVYGGRNA